MDGRRAAWNVTSRIALVLLLLFARSAFPGLARAATLAPIQFLHLALTDDGEFRQEDVDGTLCLVLQGPEAAALAPEERYLANLLETSEASRLLREVYAQTAHAVPSIANSPGGDTLRVAVTDLLGNIGPAYVGYPIAIEQGDGSLRRSHGFIVLSDLEGGGPVPGFTIRSLAEAGYLPMVVAHEAAHQLFDLAYLPEGDPRRESRSVGARDIMLVSDPFLALSEGWAEAFEALLGDMLAEGGRQLLQSSDPAIRRLARLRHDILEGNGYLWEEVGVRNGVTRNGLQVVATEGVVAYQLWRCLKSTPILTDGLAAAPGRLLAVLARRRPSTLVEVVEGLLDEFPSHRRELARAYLEWTKYMTVSKEGGRLYFESYQAGLAVKGEERPGEEGRRLDLLRKEAKERYRRWKEARFAEVLETGRLAPSLERNADPLWVERGLVRVALNMATVDEMSAFFDELEGPASHHRQRAEALVAYRDSPDREGYLADMDDVWNHVDEPLGESLLRARTLFLRSEQRRATELAAFARVDQSLAVRLAEGLR